MITKEEENEIRILYENEGLTAGAIGTLLSRHRDTVIRVLGIQNFSADDRERTPRQRKPPFASLEPFRCFLEEKLARYPEIKGSALFRMVKKRGYSGRSQGHFRRFIRQLRPVKQQEAFLRLAYLPGEQAQVDWGDFGYLPVNGGKRKIMAFIMTLSYSRAVFVHFYFEGKTSEFQNGFIRAFRFFSGVPRTILIDNLKSGVIERIGKIIRFNDRFMALAQHYRFEPFAANPCRGNEKGKVERNVRYVRENFFAGTEWRDIENLNEQVLEWCQTEAMERVWQRGDARLIRHVFSDEREKLLKLPECEFSQYDKALVSVGKIPYARYDTNDYSVPASCADKRVSVFASVSEILIMDEQLNEIARHCRCWGRHQTLINPMHTQEILEKKPGAAKHHGMNRLTASVPDAEEFVHQLALQGQHLGGSVNSLLKLLDTHGKSLLQQAVREVLSSGSVQLRALHFVMNRIVSEKNLPVSLAPVTVPASVANLHFPHHDLSRYDQIAEITNEHG